MFNICINYKTLKWVIVPPAEDFEYDMNKAWWVFMDLQNLIEPQYGEIIDEVQKEVFKLEKQWSNKLKGIENAASSQYKKDPDKAREFLTKHTNNEATKAVNLAMKLYKKLSK